MTDTASAETALDSLRMRIRGEVVVPGDASYDERRKIFNAMHDKHPAVIVRCIGTSDVVEAVRYARSAGLEIAVRSGGTHPAGFASSEGGLVVDLSPMCNVKVDRDDRTAWVGGGARGGDLQAEAHAYGLAAVTGASARTGVGGLVMHGGTGWLSTRHGWAVDSVIEVEMVTADGEVIRVAPDEDPELFWAVRGAAANFGIVTWMKLQLYPLPDRILIGTVLVDAGRPEELLRSLRRWETEASDDVRFYVDFMVASAEHGAPEEMHGKLVADLHLAHFGKPGEAEAEFETLLEGFSVISNNLAYKVVYEYMQERNVRYRPTRQWFDEEQIVEMSDKAIEILSDHARSLEQGLAKLSYLILYPFRGAMLQEPAIPMAFVRGGRGGWSVTTFLSWEDSADDARNEEYSNELFQTLRDAQLTTGVVYGNTQLVPDPARQRKSYGEQAWQRLERVKATYDPDNVFHLNHNVAPAT